jgi:dihydrofolate reductase
MIHAFIILAQTADGAIGRNAEETSTAWTSKEDKQFFRERTKRAGVVVMGEHTFRTFNKPLPERRNIVYSHRDNLGVTGIETTSLPPMELLKKLEAEGHAEVAICGGTSIYTMFLSAGVVDTIYMTIEPKIFGSGIRFLNEPLDINLTLVKNSNLSPSVVLLEYKVNPKTDGDIN